ncbi:AfsR/SARP family transcriptional regulator [Nocardia takedensis]
MSTRIFFELTLLGGFELIRGGKVCTVPQGSQHLLALLGTAPTGMSRGGVVDTLWRDKDTKRGFANLRSALWRLPPSVRDALTVRDDRLCLAPCVRCDVPELRSRALSAIRTDSASLAGSEGQAELGVAQLAPELLPYWYDDWVLVERERLRRMQIRALELLCVRLTALGRFGEAVEAGLAVVSADPLRESGHRALIAAHVAEGNHVEARRQHEYYKGLLRRDGGLPPGTKH